MKVSQITHDQTPNDIRKIDHRRDRITRAASHCHYARLVSALRRTCQATPACK
jgi:hypothetical protein